MRIGDVVISNGIPGVITEIKDGVRIIESLQEYVPKISIVCIDGVCKTLEEIIEEHCEIYMKNAVVYKEEL